MDPTNDQQFIDNEEQLEFEYFVPRDGDGNAGFVTLDSGERQDYASGMRRDTQAGKPDYSLIDRPFLKRWAELMTRGAEKYGKRNWEKAESQEELERFEGSAFRHLMQWLEGDETEDHAAAVAFNLAAAEHVKAKQRSNDRLDQVIEQLQAKLAARDGLADAFLPKHGEAFGSGTARIGKLVAENAEATLTADGENDGHRDW